MKVNLDGQIMCKMQYKQTQQNNTDDGWELRQSPGYKVGNLLFEAQLILVVSYYYMKRGHNTWLRKIFISDLIIMADYTHHYSVGKRRTTCVYSVVLTLVKINYHLLLPLTKFERW